MRSASGRHSAPTRAAFLFGIFGGAIGQVATGLLVGLLLPAALFAAAGLGLERTAGLALGVAGVMTAVGLLATIGPARRSLRADPIDAFCADG